MDLRIIFLFSFLLLCSCSSIRISKRGNKDLIISKNEQLNGQYVKIDTLKNGEIVEYKLFLKSFDDKTIDFKFCKNDSIIINKKIQGRFKKGYFKVDREVGTDFIAGPLMWTLSDNLKYIGLTKENNAVIINSGGTTLFLIAFPIMVGGNQNEVEYTRIK